ncbi:hypothetical protein ACH4PR_53315 [Streptomyces mirabilis]|uniref:hypothetical protein n=1 Tax=Streptomyces mirabilis TaxID=68239 RepID=UPI0037B79B30
MGDQLLAGGGIALGLVGVVTDDEAVVGVGDLDLLDAHVVGQGLVAALAAERGLDLGRVGAELLAEDVVAAVALLIGKASTTATNLTDQIRRAPDAARKVRGQ